MTFHPNSRTNRSAHRGASFWTWVLLGTGLPAALLCAGFSAAYVAYRLNWMEVCAVSFGTVAYHFLMRLFAPVVLLALTDRRLDHKSSWFRQKAWEPKLYDLLKVKKWKSHVPVFDPSEFSLKVHSPSEILTNMCWAEAVHEFIFVLGFATLLLAVPFGRFLVFLVTALAAGCCESLFVIIQRYNRPRVARIMERHQFVKRDENYDI